MTFKDLDGIAGPRIDGRDRDPQDGIIAYYPRNHAWLQFWENWPATAQEIDGDLDVIRALGANTVRIFVHTTLVNKAYLPLVRQ